MNDSLFDLVIEEMAMAISPLSDLKDHGDDRAGEMLFEIMERIGYKPPKEFNVFADLVKALIAIGEGIKKFQADIDKAGENADYITYLKGIGELLINVAPDVAKCVKSIIDANKDTANAAMRAFLSKDKLGEELPRRLVDYLILDHLARRRTWFYSIMLLTGVCSTKEQEGNETAFESKCAIMVVNWEAIGLLFGRPEAIFKNQYVKADKSFDAEKFLINLDLLVRHNGMPGGLHPVGEDTITALGGEYDPRIREMTLQPWVSGGWPKNYAALSLNVAPVPSSVGDGGISYSGLALYASGEVNHEFKISESFRNKVEIAFTTPFFFKFGPGGLSVVGASGLEGRIYDKLSYQPAKPLKLTSTKGDETVSIGLERLGISFELEKIRQIPDPAFTVEFEIGQLFLAIGGKDTDSLLKQLLPSDAIKIAFDLTLGWSSARGFYIKAGLGENGVFSFILPINRSIGGLMITNLAVEIRENDKGPLIAVSISMQATFGPVFFLVNKIGLTAQVNSSVQESETGAKVDFGFKWPEAVGLNIEAGPITGGGFFEVTNTGYQGMFYLKIADSFSLTAIAILTTKPPDGDYFSLKILGNVTFTPIQLGFGFFISGVGVLLAIHTEMNEGKIQEGVYKGTISNILFPKDPIKNAAKIIKDLNSFLPSREGSYVFGIMAKVGWGGATALLEGDIGFFFEVGNNFKVAVAAIIKVQLPDKDTKAIDITLAVFGVFNETEKTISLDASLVDSKILTFKITGDMAMRMCYGSRSYFALSVGGFFPGYKEPAGFPTLKRLAIIFGDSDFNIELSAYFAITENSLQFGAGVHILFAQDFGAIIGNIRLEGGAGFDALFVFKPEFYFECRLYLWLSLTRNDKRLLFIEFKTNLSGPNRFHLWGRATFAILCFEIGFNFNAYFGKAKPEAALPSSSACELLRDELLKAPNWTVVRPDETVTMVCYRNGEDADNYINTDGGISFNQNLMPLKFPVEKLGETEISDKGKSYDLSPKIGASATEVDETKGSFATGMFKFLSETEKISIEPFTERKAGFAVKADHTKLSEKRKEVNTEYNIIVVSGAAAGPGPSKSVAGATDATQMEIGAYRRVRPSANFRNEFVKYTSLSVRERKKKPEKMFVVKG